MKNTILTKSIAALLVVFAMAFVTASQTKTPTAVTQGNYMCWQNSPTSKIGRRVLGDLTVGRNNSYGGDLYGGGKFAFNPATRMMRFAGGGFDQSKNGEEWVGIFYNKGDQFVGEEGHAYATMFIVYKLKDWEAGKTGWWIQQCDLK